MEDKEKMISKLNENEECQVVGGAVFKAKCSGCGKNISYATHRWGERTDGSVTFCEGYFCNECVDSFHSGKIKDEELLAKFNQLDNK